MAGSRTRPPRPRCSIVGYRPTPVVGIGSQTATLTESESGLWTFRLVGLLPLTSWCDVCYSCHASSDLSVRCCSRALHRVASFASAWKTQNLNGEQSTNCDDPFDVEVKSIIELCLPDTREIANSGATSGDEHCGERARICCGTWMMAPGKLKKACAVAIFTRAMSSFGCVSPAKLAKVGLFGQLDLPPFLFLLATRWASGALREAGQITCLSSVAATWAKRLLLAKTVLWRARSRP